MLNLVCKNGVGSASTAYFENRRCKSKTLWLLTFIGNWSNFEMKRFRFYNTRSFVGLWSFHSTQSLSVPVCTACGWFCDDEKMSVLFLAFMIFAHLCLTEWFTSFLQKSWNSQTKQKIPRLVKVDDDCFRDFRTIFGKHAILKQFKMDLGKFKGNSNHFKDLVCKNYCVAQRVIGDFATLANRK